jgi:hypothetical protein
MQVYVVYCWIELLLLLLLLLLAVVAVAIVVVLELVLTPGKLISSGLEISILPVDCVFCMLT